MTTEIDLWNKDTFEHAQRLGKMFATSILIPPHLREKVADVTIALMMAKRLNEDPLIVMQNIFVVSGRAGWSAQYIIARANKAGVFAGRINWRETGKGDSLEITAYAKLAENGEEVSFTVGMQMARDEGWTKNPKYKSMPQLMLRYRSATFLVRLYAPEVMLGIPTAEEMEDIDEKPARVVVSISPVAVPSLEDAGGTRAGQLGAILDAEEEPAQVVEAAPVQAEPTAEPAQEAAPEQSDAAPEKPVDPEKAALLAQIEAAEKELGARAVTRIKKDLGMLPHSQPKKLGPVKLDAYFGALRAEVDEQALMGDGGEE